MTRGAEGRGGAGSSALDLPNHGGSGEGKEGGGEARGGGGEAIETDSARLGAVLHPTPYTPHPTPYTPHPAPYTQHPTPYTLQGGEAMEIDCARLGAVLKHVTAHGRSFWGVHSDFQRGGEKKVPVLSITLPKTLHPTRWVGGA